MSALATTVLETLPVLLAVLGSALLAENACPRFVRVPVALARIATVMSGQSTDAVHCGSDGMVQVRSRVPATPAALEQFTAVAVPRRLTVWEMNPCPVAPAPLLSKFASVSDTVMVFAVVALLFTTSSE
jgi:hypothetical protein